MTAITNNKLPEWRKALNKAVENYQSALAWHEENQDSPSAQQNMEEAEGGIKKLIRQYGVLIVLNSFYEMNELQELRRNYLALRGEIEGVQSQLYEAENQANEYASELQEHRKAAAEPVLYVMGMGCAFDAETASTCKGAVDSWVGEWNQERLPGQEEYKTVPLYTAPPVQETGVYKDMLNIIGLLENNEWAEHCTSTVLGSLLESEITRLVGKEQPAPVVPEEKRDDDGNTTSEFDYGWNACRAAMLQAGNHTEQHLDMVDRSGDANEKCKDGILINEGTIPVTQIKPVADLYGITSPTGSETTFTFDADEASSFAKGGWSVQEYVELERYQQAVAGNSPVTPDGWISVSERMPYKGQRVLVYVDFDSSTVTPLVKEVEYTSSTFRIGPNTINTTGKPSVTHWMPLPAAPEPENI